MTGVTARPWTTRVLVIGFLVLLPAAAVARQAAAPGEPFPFEWPSTVFSDTPVVQPEPARDWASERRACDGCPRRSIGRALWQTTFINITYEAANLIRGQVTAEITPKT